MSLAYLGDTGQGGSLAWEQGSEIEAVRSIQCPSFVSEAIDASQLKDAGFINKIPGDTTDPGEVGVMVVFDATLSGTLPINNVRDTLTITFPIGRPGNSTPATLAGNAFITTHSLPLMALNELMEEEFIITYDGSYSQGDGPSFSPETNVLALELPAIEGAHEKIRIYEPKGFSLADKRRRMRPMAHRFIYWENEAVGLFYPKTPKLLLFGDFMTDDEVAKLEEAIEINAGVPIIGSASKAATIVETPEPRTGPESEDF